MSVKQLKLIFMEKISLNQKNLIESFDFLQKCLENKDISSEERLFLQGISLFLEEVKDGLKEEARDKFILKNCADPTYGDNNYKEIFDCSLTSPSGINITILGYERDFLYLSYYLSASIYSCKRSINFFSDIQKLSLIIKRP